MNGILLVEDNQADALLIQEALRQVAVHDVIERAWLKNFIAGWIAHATAAIMLDAAE